MTVRTQVSAFLCMVMSIFSTHGQDPDSAYSGPKDKLHVYLLVGGQNMAGSSFITPKDEAVPDRCYVLNKDNKWEKASAPLNRYSTVSMEDGIHGVGPGLSFAKAMLAVDPDISIGLIVNAKAVNPISEWHRKSKVYWAARKRMKIAARTGTLKGVLWHQGEDDLQSPDGYLDKLMDLIAFLRTFLRTPELPFVAGEIADGSSINDQLALLPTHVHSSALVSAGNIRADLDRRFDREAQVALGKRYATAMLKLHKEQQAESTTKAASDRTIIDAHIHANSCTENGLELLNEWMKANNVQRSIVHPLNHKGSRPADEAERQRMLKNYLKYKGRVYRFTIFEPGDMKTLEDAVARLEKEKADGAIGFGEHYGRGLVFDDPKNMVLYAACEKVGLPVMFHIDTNKNMVEPGLKRLENVLKTYPKCVLIAHSQWWFHLPDGTCDRLLKTYPNLYADLSPNAFTMLNRNRAYSKAFLTRHADRMLFGTDAGWWSFGKGKPQHLEFTFFERLGLSKEVKEKLYYKNAEQLFGFQPVR